MFSHPSAATFEVPLEKALNPPIAPIELLSGQKCKTVAALGDYQMDLSERAQPRWKNSHTANAVSFWLRLVP